MEKMNLNCRIGIAAANSTTVRDSRVSRDVAAVASVRDHGINELFSTCCGCGNKNIRIDVGRICH